MSKIVCFCVYECAGMDISKTDSKHTKSIKNEHEMGKESKGHAWIREVKWSKSKAHIILKKSSKFQNWQDWSLEESLRKLHVWPFYFQSCHFWSLWDILKTWKQRTLKNERLSNSAIGIMFEVVTVLVPKHSVNFILCPYS